MSEEVVSINGCYRVGGRAYQYIITVREGDVAWERFAIGDDEIDSLAVMKGQVG